MNNSDLRFGSIVAIYYNLKDEKIPKQMDLLDTWFPGLIILEMESDGKTKVPAEYVDREYMIHAVRYNGKLYSGESKRVSQILGRLIGTASGNQEKERKSAELIQKACRRAVYQGYGTDSKAERKCREPFWPAVRRTTR